MKILISVYCIKEIGGISTAVTNLLNEIHDKYEVTLYVPANYISTRYTIPSDVKIIRGSRALRDAIIDRRYLKNQNIVEKLVRNIRRLIKRLLPKGKYVEMLLNGLEVPGQYDVAIAFADEGFDKGLLKQGGEDFYVVLNKVNAIRKAAWIHNDAKKLGWTPQLCAQELSGFDAIANVSQNCKDIFDEIMPSFKSKSWLVYNMSDIKATIEKSRTQELLYPENGKLHIVTVARVNCNQKKMDRIIEVCTRLTKDGYNNFDWTIVGEGTDRIFLEQQVKENGLENTIRFVGHQTNPYKYMAQADAFVLTSLYEGLPVTVKEAQIIGTPTFITEFGSAFESVLPYKQGEICENSTEGVYQMVKRVVDNPTIIHTYKKYLKENPVNNDIALSQFDRLCRNIKSVE